MQASTTLNTDVAIVGAGPSGLMLAIELGCRNVPCVLLDTGLQPPASPKANATSARTMEHYRRRGFAHLVRAAGLAADHPQDVMYCTRLMGHEIARFRIPSRAQAASRADFGDYGEAAWPTPELPHRAQQFYIEPILRAQVARYPSVVTRYGWRAERVAQSADGTQLAATELETGRTLQVQARYTVGCDGPRSIVRKAMAVQYEGASQEQRDFFGGQMLSIHFRSPDLYQRMATGPLQRPAWMTWIMNTEMRAVMVAINGIDEFGIGIQLKAGQQPDSIDVAQVLQTVAGTGSAPFAYALLGVGSWTAGYMLVAQQFRNARLLIAGDAAHLFTPTGGMGYNTSVDDAVNLGWKLAAVCQGWAPDALLDSYHAERHPIAQRNTAFARTMANSIGRIALPAGLEMADAAGDVARSALSEKLLAHCAREFNIPGLQLGLRYQSGIVAAEAGTPPADEANVYTPSGFPGARAPHVAIDGGSLLDQFGRDFTLLSFGTQAPHAEWSAVAASMGVPLAFVTQNNADAHALYGADLVLIRPDHHIAWRGDASADPATVLALATTAHPAHV